MTRQTIISFLEDYAARGAASAFVSRRDLRTIRWSYARVATTADRFARELERRGIATGDRVLLWTRSCPEWVAAFFGCLLRGVIVVPLDVESTPDFAARVARQTAAKLLVTSADISGRITLDVPILLIENFDAALGQHSSTSYEAEKSTGDAIVEIIYTSGTTAEPKGVIITHRNLLANLAPLEREIAKYLRWERLVHPVRFLNLLPLSHVFGQFMGIFVPQLLGGEVFFEDALNPAEIINTARKERISVIVTVPRLLDTLREHIERELLARNRLEYFHRALGAADKWHYLRRWWAFRQIHKRFGWKFWAFVSGGATLRQETETFWRRLGYAVVQGYGMTETASLVSVNHPFKLGRGSIGKTLPGHEVRLDENGEIMVRGESVSPGYWNGQLQPAPTVDGWLRTGDIGELDSAGNLYFKGRQKDVIVTAAGLNIYPEDLEAALNQQPEVRLSTVIAHEGPRGPEPLAVLIMRDAGADPARAVTCVNERLAPHQQIRHWTLWRENDFPRTPTQKVLKREVAATVSERMKNEDSASSVDARSSAEVLSLIARISGQRDASATDETANLATDLKLDSLGRVELLSALEDRYQIEIDDIAFTAATTLGEVERIIHDRMSGGAPAPYPYPEWTQRFPVTWARIVFLYGVILPVTNLLGWARVYGRERLAGLRGPVLFVANHVSLADQALILAALPGRFKRRLAIAMDGEMLRDWRYPPATVKLWTRLRWRAQYLAVVAFFNVFPLPQKSGFRRSFAFAGETIDRGYSVLVFPEGRRSNEGHMNSFKTGTGLLAANLHVAVVPVRLGGLYELKMQGRRVFAGPGKLSVTFGAPVTFASSSEPALITKELERLVAAL